MPQWVRRLGKLVASGAPVLLTLAALVGLGLWGSHNGWQLPAYLRPGGQAAAQQTAADPAPRVLPAPSGSGDTSSTDGTRIELPSAEAVSKAGIRLAPVRVRALAQYVTAPGMVDYEPSRYAQLSARASGAVWRVYKEIGDPIHKGEVLALIDSAEVGKAKEEFLQAAALAAVRAKTRDRLEALYREGSSSEAALRQARAAQQEAEIRLAAAEQALANLGLRVRAEDVQGLSAREAGRRAWSLGLPEAAVRTLDPRTATANLLPLTAPFDGQVVQRNVATGEVVQLTHPRPLFVVGDVRRLHVDLDVNPEDMAEVRVGQPVTFRPTAGGGGPSPGGPRPPTNESTPEVSGRVSHISPEVDAKTRRVSVHAEVPNPGGRLRPNTFGTGRILIRRRPHAVVVPAGAVQPDGSTHLVFVRVSETVFEARRVRPGLRQGDLVEVSGVRPGEQVVTTGSFVLRSELHKDRIAGGDE